MLQQPCGCNSPQKQTCCGDNTDKTPEHEQNHWITGTRQTAAGLVPVVKSGWQAADYRGAVKCRISGARMHYTVRPGLYALGSPDTSSEVFVSANYKLSFDVLRRALAGLSAWILVIDTKGINVWCAAGKGTFGTQELISRTKAACLDRVVEHRRLIVPQLGAPGVRAATVKEGTGFMVMFGPVRAHDITAYLENNLHATRAMRTITFGILDRLALTPLELIPFLKKYIFYALAVLIAFGLQPRGILFKEAFTGGLPYLLAGLMGIVSGSFLTPLLLPFIPFRSFAVKGWITGMALAVLSYLSGLFAFENMFLFAAYFLFFPLLSSFAALQYTGTTTFTGMSGVKKELKFSIPVYLTGTVLTILLIIMFKIQEWRVL